MNKVTALLFLVALMLSACSSTLPTDGASISWSQAIELLRGGHVTGVTQLHNLTVYLNLANGADVQTIEPTIDAIFDEVQACGAPCANIVLATE